MKIGEGYNQHGIGIQIDEDHVNRMPQRQEAAMIGGQQVLHFVVTL